MDINKFFVIKDDALIDEHKTLIKINEAVQKLIIEYNKQTETILNAINEVFDQNISSTGETFMIFGAVINKTIAVLNADIDNYKYLRHVVGTLLKNNLKGSNSLFIKKRYKNLSCIMRRIDLKDVR